MVFLHMVVQSMPCTHHFVAYFTREANMHVVGLNMTLHVVLARVRVLADSAVPQPPVSYVLEDVGFKEVLQLFHRIKQD